MTWQTKLFSWRLLANLLVISSSAAQASVGPASTEKHLSPATKHRQTTSVAKPTTCDAPAQALQLLRVFQQSLGFPGFQVAASVRGQLVLSQGIGYSDVARQLPVTTTTQFRVGSVSKALTSLALVKLVTEHRLDLDAPVQQYVPGFSAKPYPITTRELAGHLAGIRHYRPDDSHDAIRTEHYLTATQALVIFQNDPLLFEPGTRYFYSSFGWNLIGAVIEGASGTSFLPYMQRTIWLPLGMLHTYGDRADSLMPDRSHLYGKGGQPAPPDDVSYKYPSGGLVSTAEDLVKYGNALLDKDYLPPAQARLLFTSQTTRDGKLTHYGLGWQVATTKTGHRVYWHDGAVLGGGGFLLIYPDDKIVVAFLANAKQASTISPKLLGELFLACQ